MVIEEAGGDVAGAMRGLDQPPLTAAYPVMRAPQDHRLPGRDGQLCPVLGLEVIDNCEL